MTNVQLRRLWFQVHKWVGLILAVLIIPLSLSGAALVWHDQTDRLVNPDRYAVSGTTLLAFDRYVDAARAALKTDDRVASLTLPEGRGPVVVAATLAAPGRHRPGPPTRLNIYLDPPSARVLDVARSDAGLMRTLHILHGSLLVPGVGRTIVGCLGVAMMLSCFTGLWLWWPTVGRWTRGLRFRRHRNLDTNLHHLFGFWIALPLFVLSLTGAWIAFPAFFGALVGEGQEQGQERGPDRMAMLRAKPLAVTGRPLDTVVASAGRVGAREIHQVTWPTERSSDWTVTFADDRAVKVADDTGMATAAPARNDGGVARWMRRVHDGEDMGFVWQAIIFVGGVLPAILAVTGVIMWWRARGWRGDMARRRRARRAASPAE